MKSFDLYGCSHHNDLLAARRALEQALALSFVAHESSYHGGDYYRCGAVGSEHFILKRNHDERENEWAESQLQEYALLLYVNETLRAEDLQMVLLPAGFTL